MAGPRQAVLYGMLPLALSATIILLVCLRPRDFQTRFLLNMRYMGKWYLSLCPTESGVTRNEPVNCRMHVDLAYQHVGGYSGVSILLLRQESYGRDRASI